MCFLDGNYSVGKGFGAADHTLHGDNERYGYWWESGGVYIWPIVLMKKNNTIKKPPTISHKVFHLLWRNLSLAV